MDERRRRLAAVGTLTGTGVGSELAGVWIWAAATERTRLEHIIVGVFTITSLFKISLLANAEKRDLQEVQREQQEQREALHALLRESGVVSDGEAPARSTRG